jgi:hypothetical protein
VIRTCGVAQVGAENAPRVRLERLPRNGKSPANRGLFGERLKGFEPSTFCMASSSSDSVHALNLPANRPVSGARAGAADVQLSARNHGSFRTETGLASVRPAAVYATSAGSSAVAPTGRVRRGERPTRQTVPWESRRLLAIGLSYSSSSLASICLRAARPSHGRVSETHGRGDRSKGSFRVSTRPDPGVPGSSPGLATFEFRIDERFTAFPAQRRQRAH